MHSCCNLHYSIPAGSLRNRPCWFVLHVRELDLHVNSMCNYCSLGEVGENTRIMGFLALNAHALNECETLVDTKSQAHNWWEEALWARGQRSWASYIYSCIARCTRHERKTNLLMRVLQIRFGSRLFAPVLLRFKLLTFFFALYSLNILRFFALYSLNISTLFCTIFVKPKPVN